MIEFALSICNSAVAAVVSWFSQIMTSTGGGSLYIAIMSVVLSVGILLSPLLGSLRGGLDAGSDKAASWIRKTRYDRKHTTQHLRSVSNKRR